MLDNLGNLNERWAWRMVDLLICCGIDYFCIAPGSRSSPLALAAAHHTKAKTFVHFDERALAFHALGYSKGAKKPAVIVVTSGTAVGNLMPAVMEAHASKTPLILLTADRPPELQKCGANQTTDQVKFFHSFVKWQKEIPCADEDLLYHYLNSTISYSVFIAMQPSMGPVHLNCMFKEPLLAQQREFASCAPVAITKYLPQNTSIKEEATRQFAEAMQQYHAGLIIVGAISSFDDMCSIRELATLLKWPLIADVTSSRSVDGLSPTQIPYADLILPFQEDLKADVILQFGDTIIAKSLSTWIKKQKAKHILITDHSDRIDPFESVNERVCCDITLFCQSLLTKCSETPSSLLQPLKQASKRIAEPIDMIFSEEEGIEEPFIFHLLSKKIPAKWNLFLANSMPIRDANTFFFPKHFTGTIFFNRGLSGIDGNIATAVGVCKALHQPMIAVVGDLTLLHDISSLYQIKSLNTPFILFVINNQGGGIFSFLPAYQKAEHFERIMAASHSMEFEKFANAFDLTYYHPKDKFELSYLLEELIEKPLSCIIEIKSQREQNLLFHRSIQKHIENLLCLPQELSVT